MAKEREYRVVLANGGIVYVWATALKWAKESASRHATEEGTRVLSIKEG